MRRIVFFACTIFALALAAPARAELDFYDAVLIKQFLVCDGAMAAGCEQFGNAAFADALAVFRSAAEQGDAGARNNLAMLYETGAGVTRDRAAARRWYTEAAEAGVALARYNLAMLLSTDHILQQSDRPQHRGADLSAAYMWLTLAARDGFALAVEGQSELAGFLTPAQLDAAKRMLRAR